jgi:RecA/RadA recombinase
MPANNPGLSPAGADLGLGDLLAEQVAGETEEQRKKRMLEMQQRREMGPAGSLAVTSLFGARGGLPGASY